MAKKNKIDVSLAEGLKNRLRYQIDPLIYKFLGAPFEAKRTNTDKYCIVVNSFQETGRYYHFHISYNKVKMFSLTPESTKSGKVSIGKEELVDCHHVRKLKNMIKDRVLYGIM